jgi:hypothetical protein
MTWIIRRGVVDHEYATVLRALTALAFFGGLPALPFMDDLEKLLRRRFGIDMRHSLKTFIRKHSDEYPTVGMAVEGWVDHGAVGFSGANMSRALSVQSNLFSVEDATLAERAGGAWGGLSRKLGYGVKAMAHGDMDRAMEYFAPEFVSGPIRAWRMKAEGQTSLSGKPIKDARGRQVKYTTSEAVLRGLGFSPTRPSKFSNTRQAEIDFRTNFNRKRSNLLIAFRKAKGPEERGKVLREVADFNRKLTGSQARSLIPLITSDHLMDALRVDPEKSLQTWKLQGGYD